MEVQVAPSIWSVNELTIYIKSLLEGDLDLRQVWVRGEISNFKHHNRGHMYFTLKDEKSRILSVMFQGHNRFLRFTPENGLKVIVRGEVSLYERDGQYQLYVKEMQPDGIGNLYLAYEQLKARLTDEGLFDHVHKKKLPRYPKRIGLVTSPTGAAIRDMITTLERRYPWAEIFVIPVLVQGESAPRSIIEGLELANRYGELDLIIVGRGGGSIEELWAFNDEGVARAIFNSSVPIISAVGHETDTTIADFVADLRAATPTAAAELAVPHIRELEEQSNNLKRRLTASLDYTVVKRREQLERLKGSSIFRKPTDRLLQYEQRLDRATDSLKRLQRSITHEHQHNLAFLSKRLEHSRLNEEVTQRKEHLNRLINKLKSDQQIKVDKEKLRFHYLLNQLEILSPLSSLKRGYALGYDQNGQIVRSVNQLSPGDHLEVQFHDGKVETSIWEIKEGKPTWEKVKKS